MEWHYIGQVYSFSILLAVVNTLLKRSRIAAIFSTDTALWLIT